MDYAKEHGVIVYTIERCTSEKSKILIIESIEVLRKQRRDLCYISLDMDVLDQAFAPGCPAIGPGRNGRYDTTLMRLNCLVKNRLCKGWIL
ncbi:arginase family protein [Bacillus paranthracis]